MKKVYLLAFLISIQFSVGQSNTTSSSTATSNLVPIEYGVKVVSGSVNGKPTKILHIIFDGNIELFLNKMKLSLGNENIQTEGKINNTILFKHFKKPEWSKNKITLTFTSTSYLGRNAISITCFDSKGNDLLEFDSESNRKIKTYFESILAN